MARFARRDVDGIVGSFRAPQVQERIRLAHVEVERSRSTLQERLGNSVLMGKAVSGQNMVPSEMVFVVVRKNSDPQVIQNILQDRTGVRLTLDDARLLQTYTTQVDNFFPALIIRERVAHNFADGTHGGVTIDFAGVGSWNLSGTAQGLAINNNLDSAISAVRIHEERVTRRMNEVKRAAQESVNEVLGRHNISAQISVSGDDMVVIPSAPLTPRVRAEIAQAQARVAESPSAVRISFFPEGIPDVSGRVTSATIGESVEKRLRKNLESQLGFENLRGSNFAIDMNRPQVGSGNTVRLIMQANPNMSLQDRQRVMEEFARAVREVGEENTTLLQPVMTPSLSN